MPKIITAMENNRCRLTVNPDGNWRLYTVILPAGSRAIGTVTRGEGGSGALILTNAGIYAQCNAGSIRTLDQRKIKAALGISNNAGAPTTLNGAKRVNVYLDAASLSEAAKLGGGNVSDGIRIALQRSMK